MYVLQILEVDTAGIVDPAAYHEVKKLLIVGHGSIPCCRYNCAPC
ncbi:hypothetical protein CP97_14773 [Aurantiacibacter atlanticus]|uniref:Uncharacterized protein n=1 Tax=Aurantiacibacter atlanticus TaxID=1648404 RepID=A0A161J4C3_9SPHN|nr:hypothetical protein CP97_14773 [Aurantiacibacter atlanticus]